MRIRGIAAAFIAFGFALLCSVSSVRGESESIPTVKLNPAALAYAKELINMGRVVLDRKGAWAKELPPTEIENAFIRQHGFSEYAKWHLGIDERYAENTKRRYKFPYGDFKMFIAAGFLPSRAEQASTDTPKSKRQRSN